MNDDFLKVGIIGFGSMGKIHAKSYSSFNKVNAKEIKKAKITSILEPHALSIDEGLMQEIGNPPLIKDPDIFFSQPLDLVNICSPNYLHAEQANRAMNLNINVYCEKPLGKNYSDALSMVKTANINQVFTHTGFVYRYVPCVFQIKSILEAGGIGEVMNFRAQMLNPGYLDPNRPITWRLRHAESGGGALADLGIHMIDISRFLLGEVEWVECEMKTFIKERPINPNEPEKKMEVDVDDWAVCFLGMKNKSVGVIEVTRVASGIMPTIKFEVFGKEGTLEANFIEDKDVRFHDQKKNEWFAGLSGFSTSPELQFLQAFWNENVKEPGMTSLMLVSLYDFLHSIKEGKKTMNNFDSALRSQEVLEAAYQSAGGNGSKVMLPLNQQESLIEVKT